MKTSRSKGSVSGLFNKAQITIPCGKCGHEFPKTIAELELYNDVACPGCGIHITIDMKDFLKERKGLEKKLSDMGFNNKK